jgi:hypothetical protein
LENLQIPGVLALGRWKEEDHELEVNLGYLVSSRPASTTKQDLSQKITKKRKSVETEGKIYLRKKVILILKVNL